MSDTMKWLNWGRFFGPLSGHKGKIIEEERRYILTPFAYGTGMGPTQTAKSVSGINERQISFINKRHITAKKLDETNRQIINEYNKFDLPNILVILKGWPPMAPSGTSMRITCFQNITFGMAVMEGLHIIM